MGPLALPLVLCAYGFIKLKDKMGLQLPLIGGLELL
jgi:hypothetical protein